MRYKFDETDTQAAGFEGDERWDLVQRIVASRTFSKSQHLQAFLIYVTKQTILGRPGEIKEQAIGSQVLGRKPDYDPAGDNIVRVRARQLRQKIEQYFSSEGAGEMLTLSMPIGGYVPVFEKRILNQPVPLEKEATGRSVKRWLAWPPWVLAATFAVLSLVLLLRPAGMKVSSQAGVLPKSLQQFWGQIFSRKDENVLVVLGDSGFALWQDLTNRSLTLADYLRPGFGISQLEAEPGIAEVASRRYTSVADVNLVTRLLPLSQTFGTGAKVRFARNINMRDLEAGNVILLGSRRANPWVEIFEPHLHYIYGYDVEARRSFFRNVSPRADEPETFARNNNGASKGESYGVVALLPNRNGSGKVLLIEGLNMEGTDGAGAFILNPPTCEELIQKLQHEMGFPGSFFEILLKLTPVAGSSANVQLVSIRRPIP